MTLFEISIFGLAILLGGLAAGWVQALAAIRRDAKQLDLIARDRRVRRSYEDECREFGIPFYMRSKTFGHVAVFPLEPAGESWVVCDSLEQALALLRPSWRELELCRA
jgi:hypothetical protein